MLCLLETKDIYFPLRQYHKKVLDKVAYFTAI